jgi:hypothetical protein
VKKSNVGNRSSSSTYRKSLDSNNMQISNTTASTPVFVVGATTRYRSRLLCSMAAILSLDQLKGMTGTRRLQAAQYPEDKLKTKEIAGEQIQVIETRRPSELWVIVMMLTGSLLGYLSAILVRVVGRYCVVFLALEMTGLLTLTALGAIKKETAYKAIKYTVPPFAWAISGLYQFVRWEYQRVSYASLSLHLSFLVSFFLTMRYSLRGGLPSLTRKWS